MGRSKRLLIELRYLIYYLVAMQEKWIKIKKKVLLTHTIIHCSKWFIAKYSHGSRYRNNNDSISQQNKITQSCVCHYVLRTPFPPVIFRTAPIVLIAIVDDCRKRCDVHVPSIYDKRVIRLLGGSKMSSCYASNYRERPGSHWQLSSINCSNSLSNANCNN